MSNIQIYPYVYIDGDWSISDSVLGAIWLQLEQEGKIEHLFYDGSIRDLTGWLVHLKQSGLFAIVVADTEKGIPVHICWLKDVADHVAWAHHCSIGRYQRGVWEKVIEYWSQFDLRILLGLTPETNKKAIKFLNKICKFQIVGTIPEICNLAYEGQRVGGVISYYQINQARENNQWVEKAARAEAVAV